MYEAFEYRDDVPRNTLTRVCAQVTDYMATHDRYHPPSHSYAGNNSERASVGLPGHCWVCAVVGHVEAHPELGCGDVQCNSNH